MFRHGERAGLVSTQKVQGLVGVHPEKTPESWLLHLQQNSFNVGVRDPAVKEEVVPRRDSE